MKNFKTGLIILLSIFTLVSCKKEDNVSIPQTLTFHWHSMVGTKDAKFVTPFTSNSINFNLSDWRYYVSNFVLIKSDGTEYPIDGNVFLINIAQDEYEIENIPTGNYKGFRFTVGLDSATNHKDPTTYEASNPLSIQSPGIHWSWSSGYIFMKIEGKYDSTVAQTGPIDQPFFYHIGMDKMKQNIDFSTHAFTVSDGGANTIHLSMDILKLLDELDLRTENATHTFDNMALAQKIKNTWVNVFEVE